MNRDVWINLAVFCVVAGIGYFLAQEQASLPGTGFPEAPVSPVQVTQASQSAPDFSFKDLSGKSRALSDYKGKVVILNFWATWCPPCLVEFPALLEMAAANEADTELVALSSDLDVQAIERFVAGLKSAPGNNVAIALDEDQKITRGLYESYRLPETYVIDAQGRIQGKLIGATWEKKDLQRLIEQARANAEPEAR